MITAQSIILRAQVALSDDEGVRWSAAELVRYLNDAQREIIRRRPDQNTVHQAVLLVPGVRQSAPAEVMTILDIPNNAVGSKKRVTATSMDMMDAVYPGWYTSTPSTEIVHFMFNPRESTTDYYVYPPAAAGASVNVVYAAYPTDIPVPSGASFSSVTGNITLDDEWADALLNFVLFRAYSKDAEFGGNATMAASYLALYSAALKQA